MLGVQHATRLKEAVEALNSSDIAFLYLKQVYPLHKDLIKYLSKAENSIIVENNSTGQLAKLIKRETGFEFSSKILKFNGLPFTTDELIEQIKLNFACWFSLLRSLKMKFNLENIDIAWCPGCGGFYCIKHN
ncbi:MAG: hypothetical protein MZV70_70050 [Desulfobacterales bacterium]|nr:hypothetical protein [Desulfobacterales bacterium]